MLRIAKISKGLFPFIAAVFILSAQAQESSRPAQQSNPQSRNSNHEISELEKDNLARVAASPGQIKDVLIKDPGLLVELKRWIAKEATDNGQFVSDEDLTDNAVFDRLTTDVVFRSVATRLVQRYGYLRPSVDPDSQMGKEQELLTKERVRRLVQIEAQEDTESIKPPKTETSEAKTVPCDANEDRECVQGTSPRPSRTNSNPDQNLQQKELTPNSPNDGQPLSPPPQIMQTESNSDGLPFEGATGSNILLQNVSSPSKQQEDLTSYGNLSPDAMGTLPMGRMPTGSSKGSSNDTSAGDLPLSTNAMNAKSEMGTG